MTEKGKTSLNDMQYSDSELVNVNRALAMIESVASSENRFKILQQLRESPRSLADLHQQVSVHRTTLRRNITELEDKNWIRSTPDDGTHHITASGELFIEKFYELLKAASTSARLGTFLERFPETAPAHINCLCNCRVTVPRVYDPHAPLNRVTELVEESDTIHGFTPILSTDHMYALTDKLSNWNEFELISRPTSVEMLQVHQSSVIDSITNMEKNLLFVSENIPSFGIYILDEIIIIITYSENSRVFSILETTYDEPEIIDWAEQRYNSCKQASKPYSNGGP